MIKPRGIRQDGVVGVVAPAGTVCEEELNKGVLRLEGLGWKVRLGASVLRRNRYLAGSDAQRVADLHQMFSDPEVDAVICARGGSGTARLIPLLDRERLAAHPKIFIGCSDITTILLYLHVCLGQVVFHGPMVAPNFGRDTSAKMEEVLLGLCSGQSLSLSEPGIRVLRTGRAEGSLVGGCLTLLCTSIGTPFEVPTEDRILFIEDVDEAPYKVDRMMSYLKSLGKFDRVRGIVFGEMVRCHFPDGSSDRLEDVLMEILAGYEIPILFGFPSGHGPLNLPLPFGVPVRLDTETKSLALLEPAVG